MSGKKQSQNRAVTGKITLPRDFLRSPFFDEHGKEWQIEDREEKRLGVFSSTNLSVVSSEVFKEAAITNVFRDVARGALQAWLREDVGPVLDKAVNIAEPLIQECITLGERVFRKALMSELGTKGEGVWKRVLQEQFDEIGRLWTKREAEENQEAKISSAGILPPGTRLRWQAKTPRSLYDVFCLEFPPQRRTIRMFEELRRLAFPWLCFIVMFKNGALYTPARHKGHRQGFWLFYRPKQLESEDDQIFFPNLINMDGNWPYWWCLGTSTPVIRMGETNWHEKLLAWFWESTFGYTRFTYHWEEASKRIGEVATLEQWEKTSNQDNYEDKICNLPWKRVEKPVGEFMREVLDRLIKNEREESEIKDYEKERARNQERLAGQFREKLEEELHFLGAHFLVPVDVRQKAQELSAKSFQEAGRGLANALDKRCAGAGEETMRRRRSELPRRASGMRAKRRR